MLFEQIAKTNNGHVSYNGGHGIMRLVYGNIIIDQSIEGMETFFYNIHSCHGCISNNLESTKKELIFRTTHKSIQLYFSPKEIAELHYLLESAFLELPCEV